MCVRNLCKQTCSLSLLKKCGLMLQTSGRGSSKVHERSNTNNFVKPCEILTEFDKSCFCPCQGPLVFVDRFCSYLLLCTKELIMLAGKQLIKQEPEQDTKSLQTQPVSISDPANLSFPLKKEKEDSESSTSESESSSSEDFEYDDYEAVENFQVGRFIFCQRCGNLLTVDTDEGFKCHRFVCATCPFYLNITKRIVLSSEKVRKEFLFVP
jgi:hypothetical protein